MDDYFKSFKEMISLRGLTDHTITSYSTYIKMYLEYLNSLNISADAASWQIMRDFIVYIQKSRRLSDRTINAAISQLRFFHIYVLHKPWDQSQLPFRKFDTYIPFVPDKKTVWEYISTISDLRFKTIVILMYSAGLRSGEVLNLKYQDISRKTMRIHITHGKNRNDRYAVLSKQALAVLTEYWFACGKPMDWLFPVKSSRSGELHPIQNGTLTRMIHKHEKDLGWEHRISAHTFRHAFATHCYENGVDLLTLKTLLGHKSINSTTIYVHLANTTFQKYQNPFDQMWEDHHE
jgi:site-specific recombinase XerD